MEKIDGHQQYPHHISLKERFSIVLPAKGIQLNAMDSLQEPYTWNQTELQVMTSEVSQRRVANVAQVDVHTSEQNST